MNNSQLITQISNNYGAQSVVIAVDYRKVFMRGLKIFYKSGTKIYNEKITDFVKRMENLGAGEIILTNIEKEGTFSGYDIDFIETITKTTSLPIVVNGGVNSIANMKKAIYEARASAVAGSSFFVYKNNNTNSILINYPRQYELKNELY